jgi:hypothetical protein
MLCHKKVSGHTATLILTGSDGFWIVPHEWCMSLADGGLRCE